MNKYKILITILIILATANLLSAYSVSNYVNGDQVNSLDARTAAMGDASTAKSTNLFSTTNNPANLSNLKGRFGFQLVNGFLRNAQQRSLPMYDSFDGFVGDAEYVQNENIFSEFGLGAYINLPLDKINFTLATQYKPYMNFDGKYEEEVRNNSNSDFNSYPPIIATNIIDSDGSINAISFLSSIKYKNYSLGFEVAKLTGEQDYTNKIVWSDYATNAASIEGATLASYDFSFSRDFDGYYYQVGFQAELNRHTSLGLNFKPEFDIDYEIADNDTSFTKPASLRLGLFHSPRSFINSAINIDVEYVQWNSVNDIYDDQLNYYIGVEHKITNKLPFRMGFNYKTEYNLTEEDNIPVAEKITIPTFSAGTGIEILENLDLDLSISYSNRIYEALDLFQDTLYDYEFLWNNYNYMNFEYRGWENPDKVTETNFKIQTTLSYKF